MDKHTALLQDVHECSYDPGTMAMLERVVEDALTELSARSSSLADPSRRALTCELLAHRVMARAGRGERDPEQLKKHALWGF